MFQVPIARVFSLIDMPDKYMQTFSVFELQQLVNNQLILGWHFNSLTDGNKTDQGMNLGKT